MKNIIIINLLKIYWKNMYLIYLINNLIKYPYIIILHFFFIYIYIKQKKKIKYYKIINFILIPLLLIIFKKIIKNIFYINRPYKYIIIKKNMLIKYPKWLINFWKKKNDSSFPSGHTMFSFFWIMIFFKKKKILYIKIIIILLILIIISRILLYFHNIEDILFSILINLLFKKILFYIY